MICFYEVMKDLIEGVWFRSHSSVQKNNFIGAFFFFSHLGQLIRNCSDIKSAYPQAEDGDYRIKLADGNEALIYCHNLAGSPKEFISLHG